MYILGISTASKYISVALNEDLSAIAECSLKGKDLGSEALVFFIKDIFSRVSFDKKNLEAISVVIGPGSYSGLRGALACAKTLAQVLKIPIVAISALEAIAWQFVGHKATIISLMDAKSDEYNMAVFTSDGKKLFRKTEDFVITAKQMEKTLKKIKGEVIVADKNFPSGASCAALGYLKMKEGKTEDLFKLVPKYSHTPNIRRFGGSFL